MSRFFEKTEIDSFGNVYGIRRASKRGAKTLLLDAHIDEIGLVVTGTTKEGFLKFTALGGVDTRILPAQEVIVLSDPPRRGVITSVPPHLDSVDLMTGFYIDIGDEDDTSSVEIGTPVVFANEPLKLRENFFSARALDDRASLAAILRAVDMLKNKKLNINLVCAASTQEELGLRGAVVAGYKVKPDYALVVDVTHATAPGVDKSLSFKPGSGVSIGVGPNMTRKVSDCLLNLAKEKKIAHTVEVCGGYSGTNAWVLQISRDGIATGLLSIPLKYMHTPVETVKKNDIESCAKLIAEFVLHLSAGGGSL